MLSAEQAYQQAQITLVEAQANRYSDTAALFQALGGGWWHDAEAGQPMAKPAATGSNGAGLADTAHAVVRAPDHNQAGPKP